MGKKTGKSALQHSLYIGPIFFSFFLERVLKTRIIEPIKKIGHRLFQRAVPFSKSVPFTGEKFKNRCKKTGCGWGKKPVTASSGSAPLEFWSWPKSKMSTRSRDIPKKPVICQQKLKSRIGHIRRAATGLQSKKSKKANDSPLQNIFKFNVQQLKKIWLFYLHVRSYFLHIGV
jgi:hypothetical protein